MKKSLLVFLFLFLFVCGLHAQQLELDEVIMRAARNIEEALPQGTMAAVLNFASSSETFSDYVIGELTGELVRGGIITVVDRQNLTLVSQEMDLQLSGNVSDESAQEIGRMLGAQSIVSGTLTNMATFYRFMVRVINVETAAIQTQVSLDLQNDEQVAFLLSGDPKSIPPVTAAAVQSARSDQSVRLANSRNNWLSTEIGVLGAGIRFERMFGSRISLGVNANWSMYPTTHVPSYFFGVDSFFRWYPWGKTFFVGAGVGFSYFVWEYAPQSWFYKNGSPSVKVYGLEFIPEAGFKFDLGSPGGFFLEPAVAMPLQFGEASLIQHSEKKEPEGFHFMDIKWYFIYLGIGWAF